MKKFKTTKVILLFAVVLFTSLLFSGQAKAVDGLVGDVAGFSASSNWNYWIVRNPNANSGRGQTFLTSPGTDVIESVAMKVCRTGAFSQPKTLTLCSSLQNGWYGGCSDPIATKEFTAQELNDLVPYDQNCYSSNEGGDSDGEYYSWQVFSFDEPVAVSENTSYTFVLNSSQLLDNEGGNVLAAMYNNCNWQGSSANYPDGQNYYFKGANRFNDSEGALCDMFFKVFSDDPIIVPFEIISHQNDSVAINDSYITVTGTCPNVGVNNIGFTNDCLGFEDIDYNVSCVDNEFSGQFYHEASNHRLIAREITSQSGDCVDYDNLMDYMTLSGLEIIEGYPDDWYFNFDYYQDYDIKIKSPNFDTALTLPIGSTSADFTFGFIYPTSSTLSNLNFHIKQYDSNGDLLNENYHDKNLDQMASTWDYTVTLSASSTQSLHYVVQLTDDGEMVRQYPFGIYVSDLDFTYNSSDFDYFFPRLVDMLRTKIVFNYYFAFHDGFYNMFNGNYPAPANDDLDITFKSVSGDGEYDLDITVFSASDSRVKKFASGMRPYVVAILWLVFATYVVMRVTHLFSNDSE